MATEKGNRVNYSWTFSQRQNSATASDWPQGLWAFDDCAVFPLPERRLLLKNNRTDQKIVISSEVFQIAQLCRQFKSLEEHATLIKKMNPALTERQAEIGQMFNGFIEQGFMISAKDLALSFQSASAIVPQAPLFAIVVRTCDRPRQLERLMKGIADSEIVYGSRRQYFVVDDSRSPENIDENKKLVADLKKNNRLNIHYHGWEKQQALITTLSNEFPEYRESIQYLLGKNGQDTQFSGGRIWNYSLLLTAGKRFLTLDDDIVYQPRWSPDHQNALEISAKQREVRFFSDRDDLLAQTRALEIDPIEQHENMLGCSLAQNIRRLSAIEFNGQALKDLNSDLAATLHGNSPVLLTRNGVFGDPGTISTNWIYHLEGESRIQLVESPEAYLKRRTSRHLWLGTSSFRFLLDTSPVSTLMSMGIDNREMLPPSNPQFRNEDHLFGTLVKFMIPDSLALEFPWGLLHFPEPERRVDDKQWDSPYSVGLLAFLADIANNTARYCYASEPLKRLHFLAETYLALANADNRALERGIEENIVHARIDRINGLHSCLDTYRSLPEYWANDIHRLLQANSRTLMSQGEALFPEVSNGQNREEQVDIAREVLGQFGRGLKEWHWLWKYCKENLDSRYFES